MFCCCPEEPNTHPAEDSNQKSTGTAQANTKTGKDTVSASNQPPSTDNKKSAVTEQPTLGNITSQQQPQSQQDQGKSISSVEKSVKLNSQTIEVSGIKVKVNSPVPQVGVKATSADNSVLSISTEKQTLDSAKSTNFDPKSSISNIMSNELLKSVNTELDKLDKAIGEAEGKSLLDAKSSVPKLANQLKALNSQVLKTAAGSGSMTDKGLQAVVTRLEAVATRLESLASKSEGGHSAAGDSAVSPFVTAYDDIISGQLAKFISLSSSIGGDVKTQAALVKDAFDAQRSFLVMASKSKQPDQNTFIELLKQSSAKLQAVQDFRENNRKSDFFNHLSAISESISALGWVTVTPAPGPYVKEMIDAGTFYTNRVLKDFKEKDPKHVDWTRAWIQTLTELQAFIKEFHTTGLSWNPRGGDARSVQSGGGTTSAPPPPVGGAPPPPPPGPPPPPDTSSSKKSEDDGAGRAALFAELSKGEDVTKGLKKVSDDMKTHKNPSLRQGPAPFKPTAAPKPSASPKPTAKAQAAPSHPPVTELQGKKWVVEYHKNNKNIVLDSVDLKHSVYIYKCEDCVIKIVGKINSIVVDSCKKSGIVFDDLLASLEFVNCQSMQGQVTGKLPTLSIDKTDGCMMYLSPQSLDVEIVSAKSSEMNILVPVGNGDYKEFALPEQFKTKYNGKSIVTTPTDIV